MGRRARTHEKLEARLGYRFADPDLLDRALTHSSAVSPGKRIERSYQRLEFLGDRVLGLVVADMLYRRMPKANEGELSAARSTRWCARKPAPPSPAQLDLGSEMNLGDSEARTGGADKDAILGDITEAVIGAIYLRRRPGPGLRDRRAAVRRTPRPGRQRRADAKTTLQEWAQGRGLEPPALCRDRAHRPRPRARIHHRRAARRFRAD